MSRGTKLWCQLNKLHPKLTIQYELWLLNDEGGWNKEPIPPHPTEGFSWGYLDGVMKQQMAVMPNCPAKIMAIHEFVGN